MRCRDQLRPYGAVPRRGADHLRRAARARRSRWSARSGPGHRPLRSGSCSPRPTPCAPSRERFDQYGLDARAFAGLKVAAVGEQTAAALRAFGIVPDLVPDRGPVLGRACWRSGPTYDAVVDPINRVFLPRADIATETLVAGLTELGWEVDDVTAYRTVRAAPPAAEIREAIKGGGFDAVLFTSSTTVRNLVGIAGKPHAATVVACIGPQTAKTAEEHGLRVDVLAESRSVAALAAALAAHGEALRRHAARARRDGLASGSPPGRVAPEGHLRCRTPPSGASRRRVRAGCGDPRAAPAGRRDAPEPG